MKKALTITVLLLVFLLPSFAEAQAPTPPDVPTLGPITYFYTDYNGSNIKILTPKNQIGYSNPIQLIFTMEQVGMFGQFGNVGYSIDGGIINSITNFVNKTVDETGFPDWYYWKTTVSAEVVLPNLSEGIHNVTVYYGWQYLGINKRFEVFSLKTIEFTVGNSNPLPTDANATPTPTTSSSQSPAASLSPQAPTTTPLLAPITSSNPSQTPNSILNATSTPVVTTTTPQVISNNSANQTSLASIATFIVIIALVSIALVYFRKRKQANSANIDPLGA
jgi:hypothetical protein